MKVESLIGCVDFVNNGFCEQKEKNALHYHHNGDTWSETCGIAVMLIAYGFSLTLIKLISMFNNRKMWFTPSDSSGQKKEPLMLFWGCTFVVRQHRYFPQSLQIKISSFDKMGRLGVTHVQHFLVKWYQIACSFSCKCWHLCSDGATNALRLFTGNTQFEVTETQPGSMSVS